MTNGHLSSELQKIAERLTGGYSVRVADIPTDHSYYRIIDRECNENNIYVMLDNYGYVCAFFNIIQGARFICY